MTKNLKISFILFFVFSAIIVAWQTLFSFFGGVAINFVSIVGLTFVVLLLILKDTELFKRIKDVFIIACVICLLELIIYFAFEFGWKDNFNALKGFIVLQNIISFIGMLFFAYLAFRFICEAKNKKIKFIEIMLGNEKRSIKAKKVKATKEISNGCLEEKPNQKNQFNSAETEDNIIVETEE
ncbi:MAG: hypothetical protein IJW36_01900 [Clostridia bacterium]|nr:hypothetical protein [Clostridia bacterium]